MLELLAVFTGEGLFFEEEGIPDGLNIPLDGRLQGNLQSISRSDISLRADQVALGRTNSQEK